MASLKFRYEIEEHIVDDKRDLTVIDRRVEPRKRGSHIVNIKYYKVRCNKCGSITEKEESSLYNHGAGCRGCSIQGDHLYKVGDIVKNQNGSFEVMELIRKQEKNGNRTGRRRFYKLKCLTCGKIQLKSESNLKSGNGCVEVHKTFDVNDSIGRRKPELVKFFKNKNDAYQYLPGSLETVLFVCPICGTEKRMTINNLNSYGYSCPACGDGISYPQKFMCSVLKQLGVKFEREYSPEWAGNRRYDIFLLLDDNKYIIEVDGGFHFEGNQMNGMTAEESQKIDLEKDLLAMKHDHIVVRIDCHYSSRDYIRDNILRSELSKILDLDKVDWDECEAFANKSILVEVCKYYEDHIGISASDLAKIFGVTETSIWLYLRKGKELNLCPHYKTRYDIKDDDYQKTIQLYNDNPGIKIIDISRMVGKSRDIISEYLSRGTEEGLCHYVSRQSLGKEHLKQARQIVKNNPDIRPIELARLIGVDASPAKAYLETLSKEGLCNFKSRSEQYAEKQDKVKSLLSDNPNLTRGQLAELTGYPYQTISYMIRRWNKNG